MLELKNINKTYRRNGTEIKAIDSISISFRQKEFVVIPEEVGSGKTTLLNILGGFDRYYEGDITIKGRSTKYFTDKDWDFYRNNSVGLILRNYNLIGNLNIAANVEIGMILSGVSKVERRKRTVEILESVGLKNHLHKKPDQLSVGQIRIAAVARAMANNPEIFLCDEPADSLDMETIKNIMELIKKISEKN